MASAALRDPSTLPIATPWSSGDLQRIAFEDIFGKDIPQNTRSSAMAIPAVARARNLLVSTICGIPLREVDATGVASPVQPAFLTRTDHTSPILRTAWTVDDLMFYGWSCWSRVNAAGDVVSPLQATRLNQDEWTIDPDNRVLVRGTAAQPNEVILFGGLHEGLLSYGREALSDIRSLYQVVRQRLLNPVPQLELHQTGGPALTEPEIDSLIARWAKARQGINGGVGFTSEGIELKEHGKGDAELMIEARNAAAVDVARLVGVAARRIDATSPKASLNYETTQGRNQEFVDFDLALYMLPITARLSMDDVVPRGKRVEFDLTDFTATEPSDTGPQRDD